MSKDAYKELRDVLYPAAEPAQRQAQDPQRRAQMKQVLENKIVRVVLLVAGVGGGAAAGGTWWSDGPKEWRKKVDAHLEASTNDSARLGVVEVKVERVEKQLDRTADQVEAMRRDLLT